MNPFDLAMLRVQASTRPALAAIWHVSSTLWSSIFSRGGDRQVEGHVVSYPQGDIWDGASLILKPATALLALLVVAAAALAQTATCTLRLFGLLFKVSAKLAVLVTCPLWSPPLWWLAIRLQRKKAERAAAEAIK